ncbi:MAG: hypothetical protein AAGC95_17985 [Pseudomonadota bacterium]
MSGETPHNEDPGFFEKPSTVRAIWILLIAACSMSAVAGIVVPMHPYFGFDGFPIFYAIYGFIAFSFIVLAGQHLRKLIMRDEDYYDR